MAIEDLAAIEYALRQRGFRQADGQFHDCSACGEHAVATYVIIGRVGGRDISLCLACGVARSWRSVAGLEKREEDLAFDLRQFLA